MTCIDPIKIASNVTLPLLLFTYFCYKVVMTFTYFVTHICFTTLYTLFTYFCYNFVYLLCIDPIKIASNLLSCSSGLPHSSAMDRESKRFGNWML
jgi:hypothetical protein